MKHFDFDSYYIGLLFCLYPEAFPKARRAHFFSDEDVAKIEDSRKLVLDFAIRSPMLQSFWAEVAAESKVAFESEKGRENIRKRKALPRRDPDIERRVLELEQSLSAQQAANKLQCEGIDIDKRTVSRIRKKYRDT